MWRIKPMPTYQYRCVDCGSELETVQRFSDPSLTECPECDGTLRKVYSAVGVVFKGSGFYATDNRTKGKTAAASATTSSEKSDKLREVVWYGEVVEQREVDVHVRLELLVEAVELVDDLRRLSFSTGRSVVTRSGDN
jgi:putative regulatory protein, FmdB family